MCECCKTDGRFSQLLKENKAFRRRLSGVVFKPLYAAIIGNDIVVSDKGKTETKISGGVWVNNEICWRQGIINTYVHNRRITSEKF